MFDTPEAMDAVMQLAMRRPRRKRAPRKCPVSHPVIGIVSMAPGTHTLRYADVLSPHKARMANGASELQVFVAVTDRPDGSIDQARYRGKFTRNPVVIRFENHEDGKIATYYARWVSRRGEHGPWSWPVSMRIAV